MHALEVRDFGLVPRFDERLEAGFHERRYAAAQHRLLAEEIRLCLLVEGRAQHAGSRRANALCVGERVVERVAGRVLMHRHERGHASTLREHFAHAMSGRLRRDHRHVDAGRRDDLSEPHVESVREHQRLARAEVLAHVIAVYRRLRGVRDEQHDELRFLRRRLDRQHAQPRGFRLRAASRRVEQADAHVQPAVAQVERVRVSLAAEADDRDRAIFQPVDVRVLVVVQLRARGRGAVALSL